MRTIVKGLSESWVAPVNHRFNFFHSQDPTEFCAVSFRVLEYDLGIIARAAPFYIPFAVKTQIICANCI